jgi:hypothetical protein
MIPPGVVLKKGGFKSSPLTGYEDAGKGEGEEEGK